MNCPNYFQKPLRNALQPQEQLVKQTQSLFHNNSQDRPGHWNSIIHCSPSISIHARVHRRYFGHKECGYFHVGGKYVQCVYCHAYHFSSKQAMVSLKQTPRFEEGRQKRFVVLPPPRDPPLLLCNLITSSDRASIPFRTIIYSYNRFLAMACVRADCASCGRGSVSCTCTMTFDGRVYLYHGAIVSANNLNLAFHPSTFIILTIASKVAKEQWKWPIWTFKYFKILHVCSWNFAFTYTTLLLFENVPHWLTRETFVVLLFSETGAYLARNSVATIV